MTTSCRQHEHAVAASWSIGAPSSPVDPFGVYIHIPFCARICPYCDFNTYAGQNDRIPRYVAALGREAALWSPQFVGRSAESLFLGGGTPSLLTIAQIRSILSQCHAAFDLARDAEITIESNPNDLTVKYCEGLLSAGVNRISIGAQTLDRRGLRVLGRLHETSQIASAVNAARQAGFTNLSLDLIFGWPGQTLSGWRDELSTVLHGEIGGSPPDHLSLYNLIVEPGTPMAEAVQRGILVPMNDDSAADLYELAIETLVNAGWTHYEIANWAASPERYSRHNAIYWRNGEYAGLGAGAHGFAKGTRTMNHPAIQRYVSLIESNESPVSNLDPIDDRTSMAETMMLGLRLLHDGVSAKAFQERHHISLNAQFGETLEKLETLGLIQRSPECVRLTARGALLANSVCVEFLAP